MRKNKSQCSWISHKIDSCSMLISLPKVLLLESSHSCNSVFFFNLFFTSMEESFTIPTKKKLNKTNEYHSYKIKKIIIWHDSAVKIVLPYREKWIIQKHHTETNPSTMIIIQNCNGIQNIWQKQYFVII